MDFVIAWIAMCIAVLSFVWELVDAKDFRRRLDRLETNEGSERHKVINLDYQIRGANEHAHKASRESSEATRAIDALYEHLGLELGEEPHRLVVRKRERPVT